MKSFRSWIDRFLKLRSARQTSAEDIYYYQKKPRISTSTVFKFTVEGDKLRVSNKNLNILYYRMTEAAFDDHYNSFHRHLNLNMDALHGSKLKAVDVEPIEQDLIASWIRFFDLYDMEVKVRREDFVNMNTVDTVQSYLMKKGLSKEEAIIVGSSLLRWDQKEYSETVAYFEWYHSMK